MTRPRSTAVGALVAVAWVAWIVSPFVYASALLTVSSFSGEPATAAEEQSAQTQVVVAMVLSLALPAAALVGAAIERRRVAATLLGVAIVLALVPPAALAIDHLRSTAGDPPDDDRPRGCVELSGGTSDCPGG